MKLRRALAVLVLLAFAVIPVMADPAVVTGDVYINAMTDLGIGNLATPTVMTQAFYGYTNLYVKANVSPWISTTYWLYYYMGYPVQDYVINATTLPSTAWLISPNIFAYATIDLTKPFGIDPALVDEQILGGNYGSWDNAYCNMTAGGYEDVSYAGAAGNGYDWTIQSVTNIVKDYYVKFAIAPRIRNDWIIGFYGTPNLGFGTLRFEAFYDPAMRNEFDLTTGANKLPAATTNPTGTVYPALTVIPSMFLGQAQANFRLEIPMGTDGSAVWAGAGLMYDLSPDRRSLAAIARGVSEVTQFKYAVTGKYLMGTFLNVAASAWGTNVNILDGASWTLYLTPIVTLNDGKGADGKVDASKVTTVDVCMSGKLSFHSNTNDIDIGTTGLNMYNANPKDDAKVLVQGIDTALRLNIGTCDIYLGYVYTTVGAGAIWGANVVLNQGAAASTVAGAGAQGLASRYGGAYIRIYQPF
jgi:hypothetical protein